MSDVFRSMQLNALWCLHLLQTEAPHTILQRNIIIGAKRPRSRWYAKYYTARE